MAHQHNRLEMGLSSVILTAQIKEGQTPPTSAVRELRYQNNLK